MATPASGKTGFVEFANTQIAMVTNWRFRDEVVRDSFGHSGSSGSKATVTGQNSGEATIDIKWDADAANPAYPGQTGNFELYHNGTKKHEFAGVVISVEHTTDIGEGTTGTSSITVATNGAITRPSFS